MEREPTIQDVLDAMSVFAEHMEERFDLVDQRFAQVDQRFAQADQRFVQVERRFGAMDERFDRLEGQVTGLKQGMVTKYYLDDRLGNLHSDIVTQLRKEFR